MDYSTYAYKILNNIGRCPNEIAIKKYQLTYLDFVTALISTESLKNAANILDIPYRSLTGFINRKLANTLPDKLSPKSTWSVSLLASIDYYKCFKCRVVLHKSEFYEKYLYNKHYFCKNCNSKHIETWNLNNVDRKKEIQKRYYEVNKSYFFAKAKEYKLRKNNRVSSWANIDKIREIYSNCPDGYHVDHIIPLHGEKVSGLHVENNLQYLLAKDNISKGNKFDLDSQV